MSNNDTPRSFWGKKEIFIILLLLLFFRYLSPFISQLLFPNNLEVSSFMSALFFAASKLILIPIILYYVIIIYEVQPSVVGLRLMGPRPCLRPLVKCGVLLVLFFILGLNVPHATGRAILPELNPLLEVSTLEGFSASLLYFLLVFCFYIFPVLAEELFYRGFLLDYLQRKTGCLLGLVGNAVIFSLLPPRFSASAIPAYFLIGLVCTVAYELSLSILPGAIFRALIHTGLTIYVTGWVLW